MIKSITELSPYELGETNKIEAIPFIIEYLENGSSNERRLAASAINKLKIIYHEECKSAIPYLINILDESYPQQTQYALKALLGFDLPKYALPIFKKISIEGKKPYNKELALQILNTKNFKGEIHNSMAKNTFIDNNITEEQKEVIHHPFGKHAKVLAVAGSGKTTTMANRIIHLIKNRSVPKDSIQVLMFNKLAKDQFVKKLLQLGLSLENSPSVNTFHSFCYRIISSAMSKGHLPKYDNWNGDKEELVWFYLELVISELEKKKLIPPNSVDRDECKNAISLWKGSLIPPSRAGYKGNENYAIVYKYFEDKRNYKKAITFDDFVPLTIESITGSNSAYFKDNISFLIVDEYQDVNYGQQKLIELITNKSTDIMVVGDDDQTIYEWRGARPEYIINDFDIVFNNKSVTEYKLSHSFRFGPLIAQSAQNCISHNTKRTEKNLLSKSINQSIISILSESSEQSTDVEKQMVEQIIVLVKSGHSLPNDVVVLVRLYHQLFGMEKELLARKVPYRVVGQSPFFERKEIKSLINYITLSKSLDVAVNEDNKNTLFSIINYPSRKITRSEIERYVNKAISSGATYRELISKLYEDEVSIFISLQKDRLLEFHYLLEKLEEKIIDKNNLAGNILKWLVEKIELKKYFIDYYGDGESSNDRIKVVDKFIEYATSTNKPLSHFIEHLSKLDTTRGKRPEEQILLTSIFRTKGLEYDYVFIPECIEGNMPCLKGNEINIYDKTSQVKEPKPSEVIQNERRLFYVAITRARKACFVGTSSIPKEGLQQSSNPAKHSRFIEEIEFDKLSKIYNYLNLSEISDEDFNKLINDVNTNSLNKNTLNNFLYYLTDKLDTNKLGQLSKIILKLSPKPFCYATSYNSDLESSKIKKPEKWRSIWDEIEL
ncbi:MAG: hypothetical protein AUK34_08340 [Ignavibacteria bacterium CG2_30_36_16]|nr:ATP-dependent helicase [Ignavibacteria bacterium]OIP58913.1 MAG: hypothetical protein AUK34_08340 [Ignavibacteria bacterium CG2_30_36_16]PJB00859.1 MAG: hypothetical protein CO127_06790 [Ignavibacteria bacterium CG_4_9_14_3_um_filter_36_18]